MRLKDPSAWMEDLTFHIADEELAGTASHYVAVGWFVL